MSIIETNLNRVKNLAQKKLETDFSYNAFSYLILALFLTAGIIVQLQFVPDMEVTLLVGIVAGYIFAAGGLTVVPMWGVLIQMIVFAWLGMFAFVKVNFYPLYIAGSLGLIFSSAFHLVYQWDKVVVLRLGKFKTVHGPGLFVLIPLIDRLAGFVDTRIRATDFSAEKTLTKDTVPVHVDALAFWMIWDAKKAVLEVQDFMDAVTLSSQTALRDSIGRHELSELLSQRDTLAREIQEMLEAKTNPWGITILSIEFKEIIIPKELEDAMSKQAQAERERQARVILSSAEVEVAKKYEEASRMYTGNDTALHLRAMNMVYEGMRNNNSMMILPSSALDSMNLGSVMGTMALQKTQQLGAGQEKADAALSKARMNEDTTDTKEDQNDTSK